MLSSNILCSFNIRIKGSGGSCPALSGQNSSSTALRDLDLNALSAGSAVAVGYAGSVGRKWRRSRQEGQHPSWSFWDLISPTVISFLAFIGLFIVTPLGVVKYLNKHFLLWLAFSFLQNGSKQVTDEGKWTCLFANVERLVAPQAYVERNITSKQLHLV